MQKATHKLPFDKLNRRIPILIAAIWWTADKTAVVIAVAVRWQQLQTSVNKIGRIKKNSVQKTTLWMGLDNMGSATTEWVQLVIHIIKHVISF